jgi:uncharacterized protein YecT (DUF1311 family)
MNKSDEKTVVSIACLMVAAFPSLSAPAPVDTNDPTRPHMTPSSKPVTACLEQNVASPRGCIGVGEKECLKQLEDTATTWGEVLCADSEREIWGQRLAASVAQMRAAMDPNRRPFWATAEKKWIAARDAQCDFEASIYFGGSLARLVRADCLLRETGARAIDISELIENEKGMTGN